MKRKRKVVSSQTTTSNYTSATTTFASVAVPEIPVVTNWHTLAQDALILICSFCDLNDALSLRRVSSFFLAGTRLDLTTRKSLSFSALVGHRHQGSHNGAGARTGDRPIAVSCSGKGEHSKNENNEGRHDHSRGHGHLDYNDNTISHWLKNDGENQEKCIHTLLEEGLALRGVDEKKIPTSVRLGSEYKYTEVGMQQQHSCRSSYDYMDFCNMKYIKKLFLAPQYLDSLLVLDLSNCSRLEPQCLRNIIDSNAFSTLSLPPPPLKELYLTGCRRFKGTDISCIVRHFTELTVLHLSGCSQTVDDKCVLQISESLPNLESLDLMGFNRITDKSSREIFRRLHRLVYLNVDGCEKLKWNFLRPYCRWLKLWLEGRSTAGGGAPEDEVARVCSLVGNCTDMKETLFVGINTAEDGFDIFDFNLEVANISFGPSVRGGLPTYALCTLALASFGRLREVNVSGSTHVIDKDIEILLQSCGGCLKSLEIRCCDRLGDSCLYSISNHGSCIVFLDISACFKITDGGLKQLQRCATLTSLRASSLLSITDAAVACLSRLKKLVLLDLNNCPNLTPNVMKKLLHECPLLVELDARNISANRTTSISIQDRSGLSIFNGKRCNSRRKFNLFECCSVRESSQRNNLLGKPRRIYHCTQCKLLPRFNRGICNSCAINCHSDHAGVYIGAVTYFYCDCAFDFQAQSDNIGFCTRL